MAQIALGTVQFGIDYGISNKNGKVPFGKVKNILEYAYNNGIDTLDTAQGYGESETVLGNAIKEVNRNFNIITKYSNNSMPPSVSIEKSLELLKTNKIYGYLFHNFSTFKEHPGYIDDFLEINRTGKSAKIGFSLYYPSEAEYILNNNIPCDIIQVPYNIFDQRFDAIFPLLKKRNIEIHVRSVFLQGLFFISYEKLDMQFYSVKDKIEKIKIFSEKNDIDISTACLGFVNDNSYIDKIVIGVDSVDNLKSNISNYNIIKETNNDFSSLKSLSVIDEQIILPFNWTKNKMNY